MFSAAKICNLLLHSKRKMLKDVKGFEKRCAFLQDLQEFGALGKALYLCPRKGKRTLSSAGRVPA